MFPGKGVRMATRRQFLAHGAAVAAVPLVASLPAIAAAAASRTPFAVLVDSRYPETAAFAAEARFQGLAVRSMAGDITRFWADELEPRWRRGPAAVSGLTTPDALHGLELLAAGNRARVIRREAYPDAKGQLVSWTIAPIGVA